MRLLTALLAVAVLQAQGNGPRMAWEYDPSKDPSPATSFQVCLAQEQGPSCRTAPGGEIAREYSLASIPAGTYSVTLLACNQGGCSSPTSPVFITCKAVGTCTSGDGGSTVPTAPTGFYFLSDDDLPAPGTGITRLQSTSFEVGGFSDDLRLTFPNDVVLGSLLVLRVTSNVPMGTVRDPRSIGGNTWVRAGGSDSGDFVALYYVLSAKPGPTSVIVDPMGAASLTTGVATEYTGVATVAPQVQVSRSTGTLHVQTTTMTTSATQTLLAAALSCPGSEVSWLPAIDQFTIGRRDISNGGFMTLSADDRLVGPGDAYLSWTLPTAYRCDSVVAAFRAR